MADTVEIINVSEDSEFARILDRASDHPVLIQKSGVKYRVSVVRDEWPEPDPERVARILEETLGSWADMDDDALIEELYEARRLGSRPIDRP
jgi:hypothetical protein